MKLTPILAGDRISVRFATRIGWVDAVRDVTVSVLPAEAVGIVGESGSGKTTLARVLAGLQQPTVGEVLLEGAIVNAAGGPRYKRSDRRKVQMVFQDPYSALNPRMRAWEGVAEAVQVWHGASRLKAYERALDLMGSLGISREQAHRFPRTLSGGQLQRVSVARALAPDPTVIIADEPTSAIDQSAQANLLNLLRRVQEERGLALIFISHNLGIVRYLTSSVYVMNAGEVVERGDTEAVFNRPKHPYTRRLLESRPGRQSTPKLGSREDNLIGT